MESSVTKSNDERRNQHGGNSCLVSSTSRSSQQDRCHENGRHKAFWTEVSQYTHHCTPVYFISVFRSNNFPTYMIFVIHLDCHKKWDHPPVLCALIYNSVVIPNFLSLSLVPPTLSRSYPTESRVLDSVRFPNIFTSATATMKTRYTPADWSQSTVFTHLLRF